MTYYMWGIAVSKTFIQAVNIEVKQGHMLCSMRVIQGVPRLTTVFWFVKRGPFDFWPEASVVLVYKLEDGVGQRVYVDMVFLACVPGDLISQVGGTPLWHRGLVGLIAPPIKNLK